MVAWVTAYYKTLCSQYILDKYRVDIQQVETLQICYGILDKEQDENKNNSNIWARSEQSILT